MIYCFLANGFEEVEAITPVDLLRRAGADVKTVGVGSKTITGSHLVEITCDMTADEIRLCDELEAIILPGGMPGTINLEASAAVQSAIDYAFEQKKLICAICAAPSILGHKGLLEGKKATCYPGFEKELTGAYASCERAVTDGNFITGKGAGAALEFGLSIVAKLFGAKKADDLRASLQ